MVGGLHMHSIGRADRAGGSDQSLKRSHGCVLWAIDALMCSGVGPSRFVARWFQSIAPNCMRCGQRASRDGARAGLPGNSGGKPGKRPSAPGRNGPVVIRPHPAAQGAAWRVPAGKTAQKKTGRWLKSLKRCSLRGRRGAKIKKSLKAKRALI